MYGNRNILLSHWTVSRTEARKKRFNLISVRYVQFQQRICTKENVQLCFSFFSKKRLKHYSRQGLASVLSTLLLTVLQGRKALKN